ncbi:thiamine diphosphate-binding protein [Aspergillus pseudoustus]|uniref:3-methyl-2-oxobutanoate dehydrogenase (2-methylpropanoyl-transferring) n=1 Tax=Aspergillus pseudoustus TaxID=1810923 RepID=A0ABR4J8U9_9EURO
MVTRYGHPIRCARQYRGYTRVATQRRLNLPIDFKTTSLLHHTSETFANTEGLPSEGPSKRLNLFQTVNEALPSALRTDRKVLCFGEDVAFGGVFRCTTRLQAEFGSDRVFNTPLTEQGIVGAAIGMAAEGRKPVVEIQFADYVFPAFDQIINEASKFRYREGLTGRVGHSALYHSQSPERLFCHVPGMRVVVPHSPSQAKGLLLSSILESQDPVVFLEPKVLYRAAAEEVPEAAYTLPLSKAEVLRPGADLTIISYGRPLYTCQAAIEAAEREVSGLNIELIDLRTVYPWDRQTVVDSRPRSFFHLQALVKRIAGWSTHTGLSWEKYTLPDVTRMFCSPQLLYDYASNSLILLSRGI